MEIIDSLTVEEAKIVVKQPEDEASTIILEFGGSLNSVTSMLLFLEKPSFFSKWLHDDVALQKMVIDLYHVDYINSMAIGHITQYCMMLEKKQIKVNVIVERGSEVYSILDFCGFFELPGIVYEQRTPQKKNDDS